MSSEYAYIVAACSKYTPELCALLNSLDYVGNKQDVHVFWCSRDGDRSFIDQFNKLNYQAVLHEVSKEEIEDAKGISEITCRKRYWYAAEVGKEYKAVNILDADLIFCRDPIQFFVIAEKTGYILGITKEQNKVYDDDHHCVTSFCITQGASITSMSGGETFWPWNFERGFYNDKDLCNCPMFLDTKVWGDALRLSWEIFYKHGFKAPDMDACNLTFLEAGAYDKIIKLPGLQWLGTNEQHLKPYIRAVERRGKIFTECGLEIFCYHGQYYKDKWREQQLINRHNCAAGYLKATECSDSMAAGAMNLLYENFKKMLDWKIQIEKKEYKYA